MGTARCIMYIKCRMGYCYVSIIYGFNDLSLYRLCIVYTDTKKPHIIV